MIEITEFVKDDQFIIFSDESSTTVAEVSQRLAEVADDDYAEMDVSKQQTTDVVVETIPDAAAAAAAQFQPADSRHSSSRVRLIILRSDKKCEGDFMFRNHRFFVSAFRNF